MRGTQSRKARLSTRRYTTPRPRILRLETLEDRRVLAINITPIPDWLEVGPAPVYEAQVIGIPNRPVSGAVQAIAVHPSNPDRLYVGTTNGGVWRTDNALDPNPI